MSSFVPTQAEIALVNQILAVADTDKLNLVTGKAAVKVFEGAKLQPHVLGEIWSIADKENNGFLTRSGLATAVRLIGHAQQGESVNDDLLDRPATTLAYIEGISKPTSRVSSIPSSPTPRSPAPRGSPLPPLTHEDKAKFARLFESCGPADGLISGDKARGTFVKSNLPIDKLGSIWALADTQNRGALDQTDFTIAMYLIQASMSGKLAVIPNALPPGFYEQAGGRPSRGILAQTTGNSASLSPSLAGSFASTVGGSSRYSVVPITAQTTGSLQPLQPQGTGQQFNVSVGRQPQVHFSPQNTGSILGASAFGHVPPPAPQWDVTPDEKTRFDNFFVGLDTQRRGYIEAEVAVPFMLQSQLSQEVLAPIWDLADLNNDGCLTRDGFAIAMHLIQGKLAGKEIPTTMPESLIPPSMRKGKGLSILPPPPEPVRDLLGDDTPPASPHRSPPVINAPRSILQSQQTGSLSPQNTGLAIRSPFPQSDPFTAAFAPAPAPAPSVVKRDLLSDDDDTAASTPSVPDNSVEIGNLQNQLQSTNRSLETTKADRQTTEQSIAAQASQLSSLQTQLASAKAAYETETRLLTALRERFASQASEMQKIREELIHAESDLSGIRVEKSEIEGNLMRDKEDHRELQRKMKEAGEEADRLKAAVEKAKKDTKHQKGLLAIAKKQLASREADRAKAAKELQEAEQEANETVTELQNAEAELAKEPEPLQVNGSARAMSPISRMDTPSFAASMPLPSSPSPPGSIMSPASMKSNNPFERLAMGSGSSTPRPTSPFAISTDAFSVGAMQDSDSPFVTSPPDSTTSDVPRSSSPFMHTSEDSVPAKPPAEVPRATSPFMHVAEASTTTTGTSGESAEDPFGFGDGDGDEKSSDSTGVSTPDKPTQQVGHSSDSPISPNDSFQTATMSPSSSTSAPKPEERKGTSDTIVHAAAAQFPSLDEPAFTSGDGLFDNAPDSPELSSRVLEIEHDDSDSETEAEGENKPAPAGTDLTKDKEEDNTLKDTSVPSVKDVAVAALPADVKLAETTPFATTSAPSAELFDDAFGIKSSGEKDKSAATSNGFDDAFGPKPATTETATIPAQGKTSTDLLNDFFTSMAPQQSVNQDANGVSSAKAAESGVNVFDEAMNGITPAATTSQPQFKLDSYFEDNFDFAAAVNASPSAPSFTQPSTVNGFAATSANTFNNAFLPSVEPAVEQKPPSNAFATVPSPPNRQSSLNDSQTSNKPPTFDDAFGSLSSRVSTIASSTDPGKPPAFNDAFGSLSSRVSTVPSSGDHGISFDDVFGGGTAQTLGDTLGLPAQSSSEAKKQDTGPPFPAATSPPGSPSSRVPVSRSSVRSTSPPPRISSPRPRPSTGSSSDGGVPPSKPPTAQRHSKLSIRLPFGRKDKKKAKNEPPPPSFLNQSSTFLSPVAEPERNVTPAVEDDVEPVKQLCGMGFSRSQAVTALEKHGYNFQKALDSLLRATAA